MTPPLATERLTLRPLALVDAAQIQLIFPDWEIVRYLSDTVPWPYPPDGAHIWCRDSALPAVEQGNAWHWTLRLKDDPNRLIGGIALMRSDDDNRGFWIGRPWQRRGLMSEAINAVTDYWFEVLKFPVLRVRKAIANVPSRRISERSGMRVVDVVERGYVSGRLPAETWEITAEEWRSRDGSDIRS